MLIVQVSCTIFRGDKMKSCVFFGHRTGNYQDSREEIKTIISKLIEKENVTQFYSGGRGNFDEICSELVGELRKKYPQIRNTLFYSYIPKKDEYGLAKKYDDSVYVLENNVPKKYAIIKTNEAIINRCEVVIVAIQHDWGGAYRAYRYAKQKKKQIINLFGDTFL